MTFYERFAELCKEKNVKPTPLVLSMGLSSSNVSQWKKGSTPRAQVLAQLANYFDVSTNYLLGETDLRKPAPDSDSLDSDTRELVSLFEGASPDTQAAILAVLRDAERRKNSKPDAGDT